MSRVTQREMERMSSLIIEVVQIIRRVIIGLRKEIKILTQGSMERSRIILITDRQHKKHQVNTDGNMFTYDYECENCGHKETLRLPMSRALKVSKCPICSEKTLIRLIGNGAGFILKGDGFYKSGGFS